MTLVVKQVLPIDPSEAAGARKLREAVKRLVGGRPFVLVVGDSHAGGDVFFSCRDQEEALALLDAVRQQLGQLTLRGGESVHAVSEEDG